MSANGSAMPQQGSEIADKGKGKQIDQHQPGYDAMEEDDSESEESGAEQQEAPVEEEEDDLQDIDLSNITGSRTRGKQIDWAEAEQKSREAGDDMDDEDDEDDDDFEDGEEEGDADRMEE